MAKPSEPKKYVVSAKWVDSNWFGGNLTVLYSDNTFEYVRFRPYILTTLDGVSNDLFKKYKVNSTLYPSGVSKLKTISVRRFFDLPHFIRTKKRSRAAIIKYLKQKAKEWRALCRQYNPTSLEIAEYGSKEYKGDKKCYII